MLVSVTPSLPGLAALIATLALAVSSASGQTAQLAVGQIAPPASGYTSSPASAQTAPAADGDAGKARVDALLARMTLADELMLIHDSREDPGTYQGQAGYVAGIPRLGIPGLRLADGPPGVLTRHPSQAETATMGVAATFDVNLAQANGVVIGREARALGIDVSLQPFINIDRDLAFKRAYNTFGEDPRACGVIVCLDRPSR